MLFRKRYVVCRMNWSHTHLAGFALAHRALLWHLHSHVLFVKLSLNFPVSNEAKKKGAKTISKNRKWRNENSKNLSKRILTGGSGVFLGSYTNWRRCEEDLR